MSLCRRRKIDCILPLPVKGSTDSAYRVAPALRGRAEPLARHLRRELGDAAVVVDARRDPERDGRRPRPTHRGGPLGPGVIRCNDLGDRAAGDRRRAVRGVAARRADWLDRGHAAGREAVARVKELYDRVRTAVDDWRCFPVIGGSKKAGRPPSATQNRADVSKTRRIASPRVARLLRSFVACRAAK